MHNWFLHFVVKIGNNRGYYEKVVMAETVEQAKAEITEMYGDVDFININGEQVYKSRKGVIL